MHYGALRCRGVSGVYRRRSNSEAKVNENIKLKGDSHIIKSTHENNDAGNILLPYTFEKVPNLEMPIMLQSCFEALL